MNSPSPSPRVRRLKLVWALLLSTTGVTNYIVNGYGNNDVNMDGRTIAAGGGNDINFIINEQLP